MMPEDEYQRSLPRKKVASGILFFNQAGQLLIVKPSYRDYWLTVGGMVDGDESPLAAAIREIKEEIDLDIRDLKLLCIDYEMNSKGYGDAVHFIFNGGALSDEQISSITLQASELTHMKFIDVADAPTYLKPATGLAIIAAVAAIPQKTVIYLENGKAV